MLVQKALLVLALLVVPLVSSAGPEDLAGDWRLESREGGRGVVPEIDMEVTVDGDQFKVHRHEIRNGIESDFSFTYVVDGEGHEMPGPQDSTRTVTAKWKSKKLKVNSLMTIRGREIDIAETWRMRKDKLEVKYVIPVGERNEVVKQIYVSR